MRLGYFCYLFRSSFRHDLTAAGAAFWAEVDNLVGRFDDIQIVLDDHQGVAGIHEFLARVARVQES
jgi:hypothetical protein